MGCALSSFNKFGVGGEPSLRESMNVTPQRKTVIMKKRTDDAITWIPESY